MGAAAMGNTKRRFVGLFWPALALAFAFVAAPALAQTPDEIPLWRGTAPGPRVSAAPENVRVTEDGEHVVSGIRRPSITPYLPAAWNATGAAVIVAPGGGHRELWIDHEGYRVAEWLADHGVAAFVLKYRLSREDNSPYSLQTESLGDMQRAVRLVRARAGEWNIRPDAVGVMGFSAGGQLAAMAAWADGAVAPATRDPIDSESSKPAFAALVYAGGAEHGAFSAETPDIFLLTGEQDRADISEGYADLYLELKRAGASAELHILAGVGHGFGQRARNSPQVSAWLPMLYNWLDALGMLSAEAAD